MNQVESKSKTRVSHVVSKHKNSCKYKFLKFLRQNSFIILTVISVFLAIFFGIFLKKKYKFNHNHIKYFGFIGEIFLRLLKLLIFPLITFRYLILSNTVNQKHFMSSIFYVWFVYFSLISSIASLSPKGGYKIALQALLYYFSTTFIAVSIGICLVTILKPGIKNHEINRFLLIENDAKITTTDTFLDVIRYMKL
jgi:Na+/H+-dicarboxylate symporter